MPDKQKALISTLINAYDCSTLALLSVFFKFVEPDTDRVLNIGYAIGLGASILYLLLVPESPKWLLIKQGPRSKEAIKVLNYIAWFNGSTYRVPPNTEIDVIEKIPKQANLSHSRTNLALLRYSLNVHSLDVT